MKKIFFLFLFSVLSCTLIKAQVVINEIQTANSNTLYDEDSSNSQWIELYNKGTSAVDLLNYGLTNVNTTPANIKWKFPSIVLPASGFLVVCTDAKDRKNYMNHWETAINVNNLWSWIVPDTTIPTYWNTLSYTPGINWHSGKGPIGSGYNADSTSIPQSKTLYLRQTFYIPDNITKQKIIKGALTIDWDDGFVAYINGQEIARENITGTPTYNSLANASHTAVYTYNQLADSYILDSAKLSQILNIGTNLLAIEVHNKSASDPTIYASPYLFFGIHDFTQVFNPILPSWFYLRKQFLHTNFKLKSYHDENIYLYDNLGVIQSYANSSPYLYADASIAQIPDGSSPINWCKTTTPTPGSANISAICGSGFTNQPTAFPSGGFYTGAKQVTLSYSPANPNVELRYTLNGNLPKKTDKLYITGVPINIDSTRVLKVRAFSTGTGTLLPGPPLTLTYFINEPLTTIPIVSLSLDSLSLWDNYTGIYTMGPNPGPYPYWGANFQQSWDKLGHAEYFLPNGTKTVNVDAYLAINGNYSRDLDQKSFSITTKSSLDTNYINTQLFSDKSINLFKRFVVRNAGSDNLFCHFRDELLQKIFIPTNNDCEANLPCHVYLNGKYWGMYHLHEKSDKYYLEENHGINPDSVDFIKNSIAQDGNLDAFKIMAAYFQNNSTDLTTTQSYNNAKTFWDIDNLMDYYISEIFIENRDWISKIYAGGSYQYWINNIKLWREQKANAKWRYNLHDIDQGTYPSSYYNIGPDPVNYLSQAIHPGSVIENNNISVILRKFLQNADFKNKFINRYCDILNTVLLPSRTIAMTNNEVSIMYPEMQREINKWATPTSKTKNMTEWANNIADFTAFLTQRPDSARKEIMTTFPTCLNTVKITVAISDTTMGRIQISTLQPELSTLPWTGIYFNGNNINISAIPNPGYIFDYWEPNHQFSNNNYTASHFRNFTVNDTMKAHFKVAPQLTISELNYRSDPTRDTKDWIELHNFSTSSMNLSGWKIYKPSTNQTYTFPTGTVISPNGYMVFCEDTFYFASKYPNYIPNKRGPMNFGFNDYGEEIQIQNAQGGIMLSLTYSSDSTVWPICASGYGRTLELKGNTFDINNPINWTCGCMLGSPGTAMVPCTETVLINEINYNSSPAQANLMDDWVELHNKANTAVNVGNWVVKDKNDISSFTIPAGKTIPANGYLVIVKSQDTFHLVWPSVNNIIGNLAFGFSKKGDVIRLYNSSGKIYQSVAYDPSWGADGDGTTLEFDNNNINANPSDISGWFPGCPNGSPGYAYAPGCNPGIKEFATNESFRVYPNPVKNEVNIEWDAIHSEDIFFQLYDLQGRLLNEVSMKGKKKITVNRNGLNSGIYIFRILDKQTVTGAGKLIFE